MLNEDLLLSRNLLFYCLTERKAFINAAKVALFLLPTTFAAIKFQKGAVWAFIFACQKGDKSSLS